ncbi:MAG: hypothetical protein U5R06_11065 [candidate division KSB1 bacterium]|nr:hypothetical protein [candidate division KSB1 bacterium]
MTRTTLLLFLVMTAVLLSVQCDTGSTGPSKESTRVYVTPTGHIEGGLYYAQCDNYLEYRDKLLVFARLLHQYGVPFNLQIDYQFLKGALNCETPEMQAETGGTNVIDYIASEYNIRIDAHQSGGYEEGPENYADVRFLAGQVTSHVTENVGGVIWNQPEQFIRLNRRNRLVA